MRKVWLLMSVRVDSSCEMKVFYLHLLRIGFFLPFKNWLYHHLCHMICWLWERCTNIILSILRVTQISAIILSMYYTMMQDAVVHNKEVIIRDCCVD